MNKSSQVIRLLSHQEHSLSNQRLAVLRSLREARAMAPVLLPGFYLNETEDATTNLDPRNEPKQDVSQKEAA